MSYTAASENSKMETFPAFNYRSLVTMDEDKTLETLMKFCGTMKTMMHKYEDEWKQVDAMFKEIETNRKAADSREEAKEGKGVLCVSDQDYAVFEKRLKTRAIVTNQFDGDKFVTKIKMVDGKMLAFEPAYPLGRTVWNNTRLNDMMRGQTINMTSGKMALRRSHGYKDLDGSDIDRVYYSIMKSLPPCFDMMIDVKVRLACLAGLVAQKYGVKLVASSKDTFVMCCPKDTNKEHVREMIVLLSGLY